MGIQSGFIRIDDKGNVIGGPSGCAETVTFREEKPDMESYVRTLQPGITGAAFTGHPDTFAAFGPLPGTLIHEDSVAGLRAICLGSLMFVNIPLVKRRFHGNNLFSRRHELAASWTTVKQQEERMIRDAKGRAVLYDVFLADLQVARGKKLISEEKWVALKRACIHQRQLFDSQVQYGTAKIARKFQILFSLGHAHGSGAVIKWMLLRLMPAPLFRSMKVIGNSTKLLLRSSLRNHPLDSSTT
jgi:hypothetical protein